MLATQSELVNVLPDVLGASWVALDTEADSLHAYPEKLCLIQCSLPGSDLLIDPLAGIDLAPFFRALQKKELILHGADYDLRLLFRTFGFIPDAIFDTMWAARLLGIREFGLQALVHQHLGVTLAKGPQKMNWALRPLPERMAVYALNDTRYLQPLAELFRSRLREKGRLQWHREVCANVVREGSLIKTVDPDKVWRIKGGDRLERRAMAVLRELWRWREEEAIAANKPPYFVLSHEKAVAIAQAATREHPVAQLIPRNLSAQRTTTLAKAIQRGLSVPSSEYPKPRTVTAVRMTREHHEAFEELKRRRDATATDLEIDPTLIASKSDLVLAVQAPAEAQDSLMPWQRKLLGI